MDNIFNFPVQLQPILTKNPIPGLSEEIGGRKAVVRQDTGNVLGIVSDKYELLEHKDVIESFRAALNGMDYQEKIQLDRNGGVMFAKYKLNAVQVEVKKGDLVALQFIVKNSYDGTNALQIRLGAYRLVCSNGMVIGKDYFTYSQKHIGKNIDIKALSDKIAMLSESFQGTLPVMQEMSRREISDISIDAMFSIKTTKLPQYVVDLAREEYLKENDKTVWGYYNSLTSIISHNLKKDGPEVCLRYGKIAWERAQWVLQPS